MIYVLTFLVILVVVTAYSLYIARGLEPVKRRRKK